MANYFPCPNPACTYQFDATQLPAAAMVTCPICRTRFPYRAAPVAAAVPTQTYHGAVPDETESQAEPTQTRTREPVNRLLNPRAVPKSNKTQTTLLLIGFTLVSATVLLTIFLSMKRGFLGRDEDTSTTYTDDNFNFRIKKFGSWKQDTELRGELGFNAFLMKAPETDAWIGLRCVNIGGGSGIRGPREGELDIEMQNIFKRFKSRPQREAIEATVGGKKVKAYQFQGELKEMPVWGQVYVFDHQGIGYVMMTWAAQEKWAGMKSELDGLRDSFAFASQREKWKDTGGNVVYHFVENGDYEVGDSFGIWERAISESEKKIQHKLRIYVKDATDEDPNATILLRCRYPDKQKGVHLPEAHAMTIVLPKGENLEDAKKYVLEGRIMKDGDTVAVEEYQKKPTETAVPPNVAVFRLVNKVDKTQNRYYAISVSKVNGHLIAAVGWCAERDVEYMDRYIVSLVSSLKAR